MFDDDPDTYHRRDLAPFASLGDLAFILVTLALAFGCAAVLWWLFG